jgi:hypothetical protein
MRSTPGGQSYNLYVNIFLYFFNTSLIRYLWQLKAVVFLHWCIMCVVLLKVLMQYGIYCKFYCLHIQMRFAFCKLAFNYFPPKTHWAHFVERVNGA